MKLLTYKSGKDLELGIKTDCGVLAVATAAQRYGQLDVPTSIDDVIRSPESVHRLSLLVQRAWQSPSSDVFLSEGDLQLGPCVSNPGKIICVGQNYRAHVDEYTVGAFDTPVLFSKYKNTITGHREDVLIPQGSEQVDYEAELAVVIGKTTHDEPEETALDRVFGYCNANDLSARDLQFRTVQWLLGKSPDGFCPVGPYLVTKDEVPDPQALNIRSYLNDELRQNSNTSLMIFNIAFLISYISRYITLDPGDLILTGTPEGTILGYPKENQVWMRDGDVIKVEVDGLGSLESRITRKSTLSAVGIC